MSDQQLADAATPTFSEFPPTTYEEWRKVVDKFLKGAPFEKRLITKTYEAVSVSYTHLDVYKRQGQEPQPAKEHPADPRPQQPMG